MSTYAMTLFPGARLFFGGDVVEVVVIEGLQTTVGNDEVLAVAARWRPPLTRYRSTNRSGGRGGVERSREKAERLMAKIRRSRR
ncbi:hypothetical protein [Streptomyces massasporeus]|uniref:hypothetical protein n=1 Tax=Streptomyces massasporeus TaxID=67324 RepID=UPI0016755D90|nr:hypothetical protein [Streptomyces massasporeus]GGV66135.1 hypothetical protein GCM10010228_18510 [Streptomyces massasporeus]